MPTAMADGFHSYTWLGPNTIDLQNLQSWKTIDRFMGETLGSTSPKIQI